MTKITLNDLSTISGNEQSAINLINTNNALIETASDNTLSRDGTTPNQMLSSLDMNSFRILNLPGPVLNNDPVRLQDMITFSGGGTLTPFPSTSAQLAALISDETGTGSLVFGTSPTLINVVGPLTITASGLNKGILITQASASGTATNPTLNAINIADSIDAGIGVVDGMAIYHGFGSTAAKGARQAFQVTADLTSPTNSANANRYYVSGEFLSKATSNDGGGLGSEKGALSALNPVVWLTSSATNMAEGSVMEANTQWETSSTGLDKYGYKIVQTALDKVAGSRNDAAFFAANQAGAVGWGTLIQIGDALNASPLKTTGSVLAIKGAPTIANGIDLSGAIISTSAFKSTGFLVSGSGVITENANAAAVPTPIAGTMLQLNQVDSSAAGIMLNSFAAASQISLARAQGTGASQGATAVGNNIGTINFRGFDTSAYATGSILRGVASETWTVSAHGTLFDIITTPNTTTTATLALRVNASGGVGIGPTAGDPGVGGLSVQGPLVTFVTTVGALPAAASFKGSRLFVTDSNAASFTAGIGAVVAAGGTTNVPVVSDGTNWRIG